MLRNALALTGFVMLLAGCGPRGEEPAPAQPGTTTEVAIEESADSRFDRALDDMTRAFFYHNPEQATTYGVSELVVPRTAHRLKSRSPLGETGRREELRAALERMQAIDPANLTAGRPRTHAVVTTLMEGALAPAAVVDYGTTVDGFGFYFLPYTINQNSGPTVDIPNFLTSKQPVNNGEEAEAYLVRLGAVEEALDGALESTRIAVSTGAIPPDFVVDKALAVVESFVAAPPQENALYTSFLERLDSADIEDAGIYAERALDIVSSEVIPAYERIGDYLAEIRPSAPHDAGIWRLPRGEELYAAMVRHMTDTKRSPEEVHQIGLDEVERITSEMDAILRSEGYTQGSVGERMQRLNVEERFVYPNTAEGRAALIDDARTQIEGISEVLPQWFATPVNYPVEVRAVPEYSQDSAPTGYYNPPAKDGSRPGVYWLNLRDTAVHPRFALLTLTYHESIPGHHLHFATAIDQDVPPLVTAIWSNAAGEGWALYSEQLAYEMGMYDDDPYGNLGRLQAELHRAVRLVVDTGMHARKWSREQAIEYMIEAEGVEEGTAISEVERYAVWPGQALGDDFDIRAFNDTVLHVASAPLPYIEATVRDWIRQADM